MSRRSVREMVATGRLCCPRCRGDLSVTEAGLACSSCDAIFLVSEGGIPLLVADVADPEARDAQRFWGVLYSAAYGNQHRQLDGTQLAALLEGLEQLFKHRRHLATCEMPRDLRGRDVLEIGSGAGAHSAVFARRGARIVSLDLIPERVGATARKLDLLPDADGFALQGDAVALPFPDGSFDIVYSNGVLHHTSSVERAIGEAHRVLKPGGRAVVMLYARNSFLYRGVLFPIRGVLRGGAWRDRNWLGRATEWMSDQPQEVMNPRTEVFSARQIWRLFREFRELSIRKNSFVFSQVPLVGRWFSHVAGRFTGMNPSGMLVYDRPWRNETRFELWAGRYIGWGLNILAIK